MTLYEIHRMKFATMDEALSEAGPGEEILCIENGKIAAVCGYVGKKIDPPKIPEPEPAKPRRVNWR